MRAEWLERKDRPRDAVFGRAATLDVNNGNVAFFDDTFTPSLRSVTMVFRLSPFSLVRKDRQHPRTRPRDTVE